MNRNYFVCSIGEPNADYLEANLVRCIIHNCFVLNRYTKQIGAINEIKEGDILILKYNEHFIGYGKAISKLQTDKDFSDGEEWNQRIDVNVWVTGNHIHRYGIQKAQEGGSPYGTVKKVEREFALKKMEEIGFQF